MQNYSYVSPPGVNEWLFFYNILRSFFTDKSELSSKSMGKKARIKQAFF